MIASWPTSLPRPERDSWQLTMQDARRKRQSDAGPPGYRRRFPECPLPQNAAPPWVLPLMRLMRSEGDWGRAWRALPDHLGEGIALPDVQEAARILVTLKLI